MNSYEMKAEVASVDPLRESMPLKGKKDMIAVRLGPSEDFL